MKLRKGEYVKFQDAIDHSFYLNLKNVEIHKEGATYKFEVVPAYTYSSQLYLDIKYNQLGTIHVHLRSIGGFYIKEKHWELSSEVLFDLDGWYLPQINSWESRNDEVLRVIFQRENASLWKNKKKVYQVKPW